MSFRNADYDLVQSVIGHTFAKPGLLKEALDTTGLRTAESNQRLAMLGDALLKMILLDDWYAGGSAKGTRATKSSTMGTITDKVSGEGNNLVSFIGSNANLAIRARGVGLDRHVIVNPGHRGNVSDKTLATTVEALLGAVYLDSEKDMESVSQAMILLGLKAPI
jgi:ribonuclease-3